MKEGDIFTTRIPDGRYAAVRVIRIIEKSALVATTPYLDEKKPSLSNPQLLETVLQNRFRYRNSPARSWFEGLPTNQFELVGNIPLTSAEGALQCSVYGGKWGEGMALEAYWEWRWLHDRSAYEAEVRKRQEESEKLRQLPQGPNAMLLEEQFWSILSLLDWNQKGDDEKVLAPAVEALSKFPKSGIRKFEERLAYSLYQLDTKAHASNLGKDSYDPDSKSFSVDGFLYARCVVVANGQEFFNAVLANPQKMPEDLEFEALLSLASNAYEMKTGEELDYDTGCSYETFSNRLGWAE